MKRVNKDCNCKTKKNIEHLVDKIEHEKDVDDKQRGFSNSNVMLFAIKIAIYFIGILLSIILIIPFIIFIIITRKPIIVKLPSLMKYK